jgi:hypothetical protein
MATSSKKSVSFRKACSGSEIKGAATASGELLPSPNAATFISSPFDPAIPWQGALQQSPPLFYWTAESLDGWAVASILPFEQLLYRNATGKRPEDSKQSGTRSGATDSPRSSFSIKNKR